MCEVKLLLELIIFKLEIINLLLHVIRSLYVNIPKINGIVTIVAAGLLVIKFSHLFSCKSLHYFYEYHFSSTALGFSSTIPILPFKDSAFADMHL